MSAIVVSHPGRKEETRVFLPEGWICLHRRIQQNPLWYRERFTPGQAWVDLLLSAAYKRHTVQLKRSSAVLVIERGQILTSQARLAELWQWDRKTIRGFLRGLERARMLLIQTTKAGPNGYTLLSVLNYDAYQSVTGNPPLSDSTSGPHYDSPITPQLLPITNKENKENKKDLSKKHCAGNTDLATKKHADERFARPPAHPEKRSGPRRRPKPHVYWDPKPKWVKKHPSLKTAQIRIDPQLLSQLEADYSRVDVPQELRRMKQHALANPTWARTKKDWRRTFGNWLRTADGRFDDERFRAAAAATRGRRSVVDTVYETPKERSKREAEDRERITACRIDHERDGVKGRGWFYCPDACGWKRLIREREPT